MRSDTNDLRLFEELRLHPWKDSDNLKIQAHLAMLGVTNPGLGEEMKAKYRAKLEEHMALHPAQKEEVKEEVKLVPPPVAKPKKSKKL